MLLISVLVCGAVWITVVVFFFFQAEDGIRDLVRSRGLGDVYKRQGQMEIVEVEVGGRLLLSSDIDDWNEIERRGVTVICLLYTSDAADERSSVDLGGRRIIKKKNDRRLL